MVGIIAVATLGQILDSAGALTVGSMSFFGLIVVAIVGYFMIKLRIPSLFMLLTVPIALAGLWYNWGGLPMRIIYVISLIIMGYVIAHTLSKIYGTGFD